MVMALDAPSFEDVYRTHYGRVRALAARLVADPSVAEEVAHDVFLWFWRNRDRFDPGRGTLSAFLASATRGRAIDRIRADTARRRRELRHGESLAMSAPAAEAHALRELAAADVHAALCRLPDAERVAIVLAYFGGRTYRQVADELGEPEGTIKSRIRSGLRRLRTAPGTTPL